MCTLACNIYTFCNSCSVQLHVWDKTCTFVHVYIADILCLQKVNCRHQPNVVKSRRKDKGSSVPLNTPSLFYLVSASIFYCHSQMEQRDSEIWLWLFSPTCQLFMTTLRAWTLLKPIVFQLFRSKQRPQTKGTRTSHVLQRTYSM